MTTTITNNDKTTKNQTWPQYLAAFTCLISMFASGIHFGWPSPSLPRLFSEEYPFNVTQEEASYVTVIGPIGDLFGSIAATLLVDSAGRKRSILLIGLPQIVSMAMIYLSDYTKVLLYAARFIGGVSEGACFSILPIYICEMSEPRIRGTLGASFSMSLMLGMLFVNVVGSYVSIKAGALIYASFSLIFLVAFAPMPESPYFLLMKNKTEETRSCLRRLRGCEDVEEELAGLTKDVARQMSERGRFKDLITIKSNRMAVLIMIMLRILQQFSGASSFTIYAQLLLKESTDSIPQHFGAIILVLVQAVSNIVAVSIVDVVGRKPLILTSVGGCCLCLIFDAAFFSFRDFTDVDVSGYNVLPLFGLVLFFVCFSLGLGCAVNLLGGELFPANVKAKGLFVMNLMFSVGMFASTKFYQFTADELSLAIPFWVFGVIELVGFFVCWRVVPETKNKSLEEIQQEMKGNYLKK